MASHYELQNLVPSQFFADYALAMHDYAPILDVLNRQLVGLKVQFSLRTQEVLSLNLERTFVGVDSFSKSRK